MTRLYIILAAIGGFLLAALRLVGVGRDAEKGRQANDTLDRINKGRDAIRDGDPDKRLRDNDGRW